MKNDETIKNQERSLLGRLDLHINDPWHFILQDYPLRDDLIALQILIENQRREIALLNTPAVPPVPTHTPFGPGTITTPTPFDLSA